VPPESSTTTKAGINSRLLKKVTTPMTFLRYSNVLLMVAANTNAPAPPSQEITAAT